ncbi:hypothetical protein FNV62_38245 [Streptomyces sp. RLB3-17]|nr:hypothetical protein FNV64_40655 [Streptomyces sp. S1A1-7]QDO43214.1 hypothetical protein FNV62_38245 [Streptomyces sp. RLB3-17]
MPCTPPWRTGHPSFPSPPPPLPVPSPGAPPLRPRQGAPPPAPPHRPERPRPQTPDGLKVRAGALKRLFLLAPADHSGDRA